jgi:hypothetical protein
VKLNTRGCVRGVLSVIVDGLSAEKSSGCETTLTENERSIADAGIVWYMRRSCHKGMAGNGFPDILRTAY